MKTLNELIENVIAWSESRGIYANSTAERQHELYIEETAELHEAMKGGNRDEIMMEYGDRIVTITNSAALLVIECGGCIQNIKERFFINYIDHIFGMHSEEILREKHGFTLEEALQAAYDKISKRKHSGFFDGKLIKDGE